MGVRLSVLLRRILGTNQYAGIHRLCSLFNSCVCIPDKLPQGWRLALPTPAPQSSFRRVSRAKLLLFQGNVSCVLRRGPGILLLTSWW